MKTIEEPYAYGPALVSELLEDRVSWFAVDTPAYAEQWTDDVQDGLGPTHRAPRIYGFLGGNATFAGSVEGGEAIEIASDHLASLFSAVADSWVSRTQFSSSLEAIFSDPMLATLLDMGPVVLPFAFARFVDEPERWHHVLVELSGQQPLGPDTTRDQAAGMWARALGLDAD